MYIESFRPSIEGYLVLMIGLEIYLHIPSCKLSINIMVDEVSVYIVASHKISFTCILATLKKKFDFLYPLIWLFSTNEQAHI